MWKKFDLSTTHIQRGDVEIAKIKIDGYLDSSTFPKLQEYLSSLVAQGQFRLLLDLSDLDYISSAGLGVLMGMLREVREKGGDLKIVNMSEKIERVFNLLGFSRILRLYSAEERAVEDFAQGVVGQPTRAEDDEAY